MKHVAGFTLWELLVVIALVVFLFAAAIENLLPLRGAAESASVAATVGALHSAVGMEAMRRVLRGKPAALADMHAANPMTWLVAPPANYAGIVDGTAFHDVPPGHWAYATSGVLFYRVRYPQYFHGDFQAPPGMRFQVVVERARDGGTRNVQLTALDAGEWRTEGSEIQRWITSQ